MAKLSQNFGQAVARRWPRGGQKFAKFATINHLKLCNTYIFSAAWGTRSGIRNGSRCRAPPRARPPAPPGSASRRSRGRSAACARRRSRRAGTPRPVARSSKWSSRILNFLFRARCFNEVGTIGKICKSGGKKAVQALIWTQSCP